MIRNALVGIAVGAFLGLAVEDALHGRYKTAAISAMLAVVNGLVLA